MSSKATSYRYTFIIVFMYDVHRSMISIIKYSVYACCQIQTWSYISL